MSEAIDRPAEAGRTDDAWWSWHDADQSRIYDTTEDAEAACAAWCAGTSDVGPEIQHATEPYEASLADALDWASDCDAGDYLVEYIETGMTDVEDPGSRCGYGDDELDAIRRALAERGMTLAADDRGLVAQAVRS